MMIKIVVVVQLSWTKAMKVKIQALLIMTRLRHIFITENRHDNVWQQNGLRVVSIFVQNQHCLQCLLLLQSKNASHRCGFHIKERNDNKNINKKNKCCKFSSLFFFLYGHIACVYLRRICKNLIKMCSFMESTLVNAQAVS